ncbi:MAG TPA: riboflavin synthase [Vicinamibacterales bacterium]|nr:riboflavin synthase [Vicinamibacterales bacterium]
MFTGLVEAVGELVERTPTSGGVRLRIATGLARELALGDSLAVNGVCLTITRADQDAVYADVGPETLRVTTLGSINEGAPVNLERPLRADGRIGGHFVQGHVDGVGQVESLRADADFHWLTVAFPRRLAPFMVNKGSIAVDGISLTIAALGGDRFDIQIVPYTMQHTNLRRVEVRDRVNLECDMVGKYVARAIELAGLNLTDARPGEVTH